MRAVYHRVVLDACVLITDACGRYAPGHGGDSTALLAEVVADEHGGGDPEPDRKVEDGAREGAPPRGGVAAS